MDIIGKNPALRILEQRILLIALIIAMLWFSFGDERDALSSMLGSGTSIFTIRIYEKVIEMMLSEKKGRVHVVYLLLMKLTLLGVLAIAVFLGLRERLIISFLSGFLAFVPACLVILGNPALHFDKDDSCSTSDTGH